MELREFKRALASRGHVYISSRLNREPVRLTPKDIKVGRKWVTWQGERFQLLSDMTLRCSSRSYKLSWEEET